jgi:hypothetical protein
LRGWESPPVPNDGTFGRVGRRQNNGAFLLFENLFYPALCSYLFRIAGQDFPKNIMYFQKVFQQASPTAEKLFKNYFIIIISSIREDA